MHISHTVTLTYTVEVPEDCSQEVKAKALETIKGATADSTLAVDVANALTSIYGSKVTVKRRFSTESAKVYEPVVDFKLGATTIYFTESEHNQIINDYMAGVPVHELAKRHNVHRTTMGKYIMRTAGVKYKGRRRNQLSNEQLDELVYLRESGVPVKELAITYGRQDDAIYRNYRMRKQRMSEMDECALVIYQNKPALFPMNYVKAKAAAREYLGEGETELMYDLLADALVAIK